MRKLLRIAQLMLAMHRFFFGEGLTYIRTGEGLSRRNQAYLPLAYLRFMGQCFQDTVRIVKGGPA